AHPIQFPLDPRLAVPFFYSTVPGPFFLSWAYFLSHSPSRVVSSLATAAPHVLGAQLDSTSSRASTAVCALSICPRLFSLRPHYCSAYGYDSRPTQTPSWLDTTAFNLVVPIPRDPIRIPARRLYIARTCCTNLPYSVHHLTCFVLRTANPAFIRVPGTVHCIACPPFLLLLRAPLHKTNTQSRSEAYPACCPYRHQPRHSLSQNPSQFGSVFPTKSTRSADPSLRIPLLPDSLTSHSLSSRPQHPRCPTRPQPALALGPIRLPLLLRTTTHATGRTAHTACHAFVCRAGCWRILQLPFANLAFQTDPSWPNLAFASTKSIHDTNLLIRTIAHHAFHRF
ncbi:hypothetical protein BDP67DRAFT_460295, partial [Colletotrichum lupini]